MPPPLPSLKLTPVERHLIAESFRTARLLNQTPRDSPSYPRLQQRLYDLQAQLSGCCHRICEDELLIPSSNSTQNSPKPG